MKQGVGMLVIVVEHMCIDLLLFLELFVLFVLGSCLTFIGLSGLMHVDYSTDARETPWKFSANSPVFVP